MAERDTQDAPNRAEANPTDPMTLVCLGWVPWGQSWKRNQSMFYQLSRLEMFDRSVFVNPGTMTISDEIRFGDGSLAHRINRVRGALPHRYDDKIQICQMLSFVPFKRWFSRGHVWEEVVFRKLIERLRGKGPFVLLNNHPNFVSSRVLDDLMEKARLTLFDLSDDFVEFFEVEKHRRLFDTNIRWCCKHSDVVFMINDHLKQKYGHDDASTYVIPNSTNFSNFHRSEFDPVPFLEPIKARGPVLGCTGIINRIRIDYALLEELTSSRPDYQYVFVGSCDRSFLDLVERIPNLHHHRQVPYAELPNWIANFDAAIIPFRINEHTRGNDLLKFNDYLAMGKAIVTTDTAGARRYENELWVADEKRSFLACIDEALEDRSQEARKRRIEIAQASSWDRRAVEIEAILKRHLEAKAV